MNHHPGRIWIVIFCTAALLSACQNQATPGSTIPQIVATTSILANVVGEVGGSHINVLTLVPAGVNEHEYIPAPRDIVKVTEASLVFEVGLGLEEFMPTLLDGAGSEIHLITVSNGIEAKDFTSLSGEPKAGDHPGGDPHVWLDPANVVIWVENITAALIALDPAHTVDYQENGARYTSELEQLDAWIASEVAQIPPVQRKIVTDHALFGYFAEKYGFEIIGAVIPSYSTSAQPSAQELAALEDSIRAYDVRFILVGSTVNPALSKQLAEDTGIELVPFYTGSLSSTDGPAGTYLDYMRYNVTTIKNAVSQGSAP